MKFYLTSLLLTSYASKVLSQSKSSEDLLYPVNPEWTSQYDLSNVPNKPLRLSGSGLCKNATCDASDCDRCYESCGNCPRKEDIYGCEAGEWALTFDDGPSPYTVELLDILAAANVKVTFLMVGSNVVKYPEIVKRAFDEGHQISQHTWSHPHLMSISDEQIVAELRATEDAIFNITGARTAFVRPPYGEADDRVKGVFKAMGYYNLLWNMDTLDWDIVAKNQDAGKIIDSFENALTKGTGLNPFNDPGYISLQHDLYVETVKRVPKIEEILAQHNFHFVLAHDCINVAPYQNTPITNSIPSITPINPEIDTPTSEPNEVSVAQGSIPIEVSSDAVSGSTIYLSFSLAATAISIFSLQ
ncbi:chitin deacetylase [Basidiobolus ranarum]|uniref:Chitin deacetylase n=1 Tax=Basidiobolus ranarum TaxID=34480 RepID=A0ABR2WXM5_9FUNG